LGISLYYGGEDAGANTITRWNLKSDFLTPTDGWSLTFLDQSDAPIWFELQPVELYVDGRLQLIGRCDISERGGNSSLVTLSGRDYLADLTTCSIDPTFVVKAGTKLEDALLMAMGPCGITAIEGPAERNSARTGGASTTNPTISAKQLQDLKPGDSESIFAWGSKLAARYGYTLQPSNKRNAVVLQRPSYGGGAVGKITSRKRGEAAAANMLIGGSGKAVRDYSELPTYLVTAGQQGGSSEGRAKGQTTWEMFSMASLLGEEFSKICKAIQVGRRIPKDVVGTEIENAWLYRLRSIRDKRSRTQEEVDAAAARFRATALKASLKYSCTIKGTTTERDGGGYTWAPDIEVDVDDDLARVHERLWVASREFSGSEQGTQTSLECWRPRSFQIDSEGG
jgi:prophage tail gpP-like protein